MARRSPLHRRTGADQGPHPPKAYCAVDQYFQVNARREVRPGAGITPSASGSR